MIAYHSFFWVGNTMQYHNTVAYVNSTVGQKDQISKKKNLYFCKNKLIMQAEDYI